MRTLAAGKMPATDVYLLETAALLHDIGKIGVPDAILLKPGPLNGDEWKVINAHERIGVEIIRFAFANENWSRWSCITTPGTTAIPPVPI